MKLNDKIVCDLCGRTVKEENAVHLDLPIKVDDECFYPKEYDACNYCANKINELMAKIMVGNR